VIKSVLETQLSMVSKGWGVFGGFIPEKTPSERETVSQLMPKFEEKVKKPQFPWKFGAFRVVQPGFGMFSLLRH